jgi:hypothetical protein
MPFAPDILVTTPDGFQLVVEAKTSLPDLHRTEAELKQYMVRMQCPIGLLVTPDRLWLYKDSYLARSPQSVERVGEYNARSLWHQVPPTNPVWFETFVQHWLEDLPTTLPSALPSDLRDALRQYVVPAVAGGNVRAAHPRAS